MNDIPQLTRLNSSTSDWLTMYRHADQYVDADTVERKIDLACERIAKNARGKVAYGWSGGKDSQALRVICERAGVKASVLSDLGETMEYPVMRQWKQKNRPDGCTIMDWHLGYDWLREHDELLFPKNGKASGQWYNPQRKAWMVYYESRNLDAMIFGHRTADLNHCGKEGVYTKGDMLKVCPMYDFTHMELLAILKAYQMPMAPVYTFPFADNFELGPHGWPERQQREGQSEDVPMREVLAIYPLGLIKAAPHIERIARFLDREGIAHASL